MVDVFPVPDIPVIRTFTSNPPTKANPILDGPGRERDRLCKALERRTDLWSAPHPSLKLGAGRGDPAESARKSATRLPGAAFQSLIRRVVA